MTNCQPYCLKQITGVFTTYLYIAKKKNEKASVN